jgi:hypothetical protein
MNALFVFQDKHYIVDLDMQPFLASQIASIIRSCSLSFLAEIREWQRVCFFLKNLQIILIFHPGLAYYKCASDSQFQTVLNVVSFYDLISASLAFILFAMESLMRFMREPKFPFYDDLGDAAAAMAFTFPPPRGMVPAEQRADDVDRIMDHYTCFNDPFMRDFISSLDDYHQNFLNTTLDTLHKRLPAFPSSFRIWDTMPGHNMSIRSSYSLCH